MVSHEIQTLSDEQLRSTLVEYNVTVGPITKTTRKLYERKLARLWQQLPAITLFSDEKDDEEEEEDEKDDEEEEEEEETKQETNVSSRSQFSDYSAQFTSYSSNPQISSSHLSSSLRRRPLNSGADQDKSSYTSLREPGVSSSAVPAKAGMSWITKLLIMIVLGFMLWMIIMNFEYQPSVPSLTNTN
uniref:LEM domain-containing protein n=1 Tax=Octopus bimaculoides TaxID=37653 RepID=A0A0L8FMM9_OCTBM